MYNVNGKDFCSAKEAIEFLNAEEKRNKERNEQEVIQKLNKEIEITNAQIACLKRKREKLVSERNSKYAANGELNAYNKFFEMLDEIFSK